MRHIEQGPIEIIFRNHSKREQIFYVNSDVGSKIKQFLEEQEANKESEWIPAKEVFPDLKDPKKRIASCLRGARYREEMTQKQLAKKLKILPHHISEMENGKRSISKEMAKKLAVVLKCNYKVFL